jgi:hypothetical protein
MDITFGKYVERLNSAFDILSNYDVHKENVTNYQRRLDSIIFLIYQDINEFKEIDNDLLQPVKNLYSEVLEELKRFVTNN